MYYIKTAYLNINKYIPALLVVICILQPIYINHECSMYENKEYVCLRALYGIAMPALLIVLTILFSSLLENKGKELLYLNNRCKMPYAVLGMAFITLISMPSLVCCYINCEDMGYIFLKFGIILGLFSGVFYFLCYAISLPVAILIYMALYLYPFLNKNCVGIVNYMEYEGKLYYAIGAVLLYVLGIIINMRKIEL